MLIISRRLNESFLIGDDIVVTVIGIKGNQVRIGIDAPADIPVHREEIYRRITESGESTMSAKRSLIEA